MATMRVLCITMYPPTERKLPPVSHVLDYFELELCPFKSDRIKKLQMDLCEFSKPSIDYGDVLHVGRKFDFERFISEPIASKRDQFLLDSVCKEVIDFGLRFGWDVDAVTNAAATVRNAGFYFKGDWGRPKTARSRVRRASIFVDYEIVPKIFLRIYERDILVSEILLSVGKAGFESVAQACKKIEWQNNDLVRIYNENLRDYWDYRLSESCLEYHFHGGTECDGHRDFILSSMYLEGRIVLKDLALGKQLLERAAELGYAHAIRKLAKLRRKSG